MCYQFPVHDRGAGFDKPFDRGAVRQTATSTFRRKNDDNDDVNGTSDG